MGIALAVAVPAVKLIADHSSVLAPRPPAAIVVKTPEAPPAPERSPRPRGPQTMADLMERDESEPAGVRSVTSLLDAARDAMANRDLATAANHVEAATELAQSPTEQDAARRTALVYRSVDSFWRAVRAGLSHINGGDELPVGDSPVMIVETGSDELLIRAAGQNRSYAVDSLPCQLAVALAEHALPKDRPGTHLAVGSFLAIDARGDRTSASEHLQLAGADGQAVLAELGLLTGAE